MTFRLRALDHVICLNAMIKDRDDWRAFAEGYSHIIMELKRENEVLKARLEAFEPDEVSR